LAQGAGALCHGSKLPQTRLAIRLTPSGVMDRLKIHPEQGRGADSELVFCYSGRVELRL